MELKHGYKQSEIGVIPSDWQVARLGDCLARRPSYGINAPAVAYSDRLPTYIRITDISEDGRFVPPLRASVRSAMSGQYYLEDGDIVLARTGASVGKSYKYRNEDGPLVYAGFLIRVSPNAARLEPEFASAYLRTGAYWRWVRLMSMRSGQPGINGNEYAQLPIPLPSLQEQRAIAEALSDADALLDGLDRLIAKKRDLKQATMQQLLAGKTRLPGFSGEWEVKRLSQLVSTPISDGPHLTPEFLSDGVPFLSVNNLIDNEIDLRSPRFISQSDHSQFSKKCKPQKGDILFGKAASVGMVALVRTDLEFNIWSPLALIRVARPNQAAFVCYALQTSQVRRQIDFLTNSSSQGNIGMDDIGAIFVPVPTPEEQAAISEVLASIDVECRALEARRDKVALLKHAMMQELLTGKTRLVAPEADHA
jgi:type I restriction enzyme S subunit